MAIETSVALGQILRGHPIDASGSRLWDDAIEQAFSLPLNRSGRKGEAPAERLTRLRDALKGELVAFHDRLIVEPYRGTDLACPPGEKLWTVAVPLTLFPKRDHGFTRIECIVELSSEEAPDAFRVIKVLPEPRSEVVARAEMGATLDIGTNAKLGVNLPLPPELKLVGSVAAEVYGKAKADFTYEARRVCVETEIIGGKGARWRLDDVSHPEKVGTEGHQFVLIMSARSGTRALHAAGVLQAFSDVRWLTASLGSFWQNLVGKVREFFGRGAPSEAYGEWSDVLPDN